MSSSLQERAPAPAEAGFVVAREGGAAAGGARVPLVSAYLMFFCSGLASLICEVVWFKQLQFVLGSSTFAVSVVVACFFGGLGLGSFWGGRRADGWRRPLRAYAFLELSLAGASAAATLVLAGWEVWVAALAPWLGPQSAAAKPLCVLVSLLVLLPPTALMGATLPVLAKHLIREHALLARRLGTLYGLNTLGAATGCALVGFVLIGSLGVLQSALVASGVYAAIGVTALALSRRAPAFAPPAAVEESGPAAAGGVPERGAATLVAVFALMGLAAIAYEVLWFRILTCFSHHTVHAFAGMLSVYLLGLVLGALICARYLAPRKDRHLVYFARLQLLVALAAFASLGLLGRSRLILLWLTDLEKALGVHAFFALVLADASPFIWLSLLTLLVPTTLLGVGFPLAAELTVRHLPRLGSRLGVLYSLNTLGGVLGSLLTGFVLLPLLGSQGSFLAVIALNLGLFVLLVASQPSLRRQRGLWREGVWAAAGLGAGLGVLGLDYLQDAQTRFIGPRTLAFRESTDATFALLEYDFPQHSGRFQQLLVNGESYASNAPAGRRYMGSLAHLPALVHPEPKSGLVICVGTGTTVGALTLHPSVEQVWAVDLSREVFEFAPHFVPLNQRFHESPKVRQVTADGRHFLLCTDQTFDVLTFEPPPPADAGVVNLYSQEFYRLAKRRMKPGGVLCQWMPLDLSRDVLPRMMIRTLMAEFPHVSLWIPSRMEGIAIASHEPLRIDPEQLRRRLAEPRVRGDLAEYGLGEPEQLLGTFLAADADLARFVGPVPVVTDDRPRIEYFNFYPPRVIRYDDILPYRRPVEAHLTRPPDAARLEACREVATHIWYSYELKRDRQFDAVRDRLERALRLDPGNPYLRYLRASVEDDRVP
jgi:spermidine synthase